MRLRYGRIALAIGALLLAPALLARSLVPVAAPPPPARIVAEARSCDAGEVLEAAVALRDDEHLDLNAVFSTSPVDPVLARQVLDEADHQRASIAALRQAAHCDRRTSSPEVSIAVFRVAQLTLAEAKIRGDADEAMDVADVGVDLAETGNVMGAAMGVTATDLALDVLDGLRPASPDLARRADAIARRPFDADALLARDGAASYDRFGLFGYLWSRSSCRALARTAADQWADNAARASRLAGTLY